MFTLKELFQQQSKNNQKNWNSSNFRMQNYSDFVLKRGTKYKNQENSLTLYT